MGTNFFLIIPAMVDAPKTETQLKKSRRLRATSLTVKQAAKTRLVRSKNARGALDVVSFKRLETLYREVALDAKEKSELTAKSAQSGQIYVEGQPKLLLVVRIKGIRKVP